MEQRQLTLQPFPSLTAFIDEFLEYINIARYNLNMAKKDFLNKNLNRLTQEYLNTVIELTEDAQKFCEANSNYLRNKILFEESGNFLENSVIEQIKTCIERINKKIINEKLMRILRGFNVNDAINMPLGPLKQGLQSVMVEIENSKEKEPDEKLKLLIDLIAAINMKEALSFFEENLKKSKNYIEASRKKLENEDLQSTLMCLIESLNIIIALQNLLVKVEENEEKIKERRLISTAKRQLIWDEPKTNQQAQNTLFQEGSPAKRQRLTY